MRDLDVRCALVNRIAREFTAKPHVLVPEVDVRWSIPTRLDALLVSDRICGFEIKSDVDSLSRLRRQVEAYNYVVERAVLVVGERHKAAATEMVPDWWSIWTARWQGDVVRIGRARRGRLNPAINALAVTSFMTRDSLADALRACGRTGLSTLSVDQLRTSLVETLGAPGALKAARASMLRREDWRYRSLLAA